MLDDEDEDDELYPENAAPLEMYAIRVRSGSDAFGPAVGDVVARGVWSGALDHEPPHYADWSALGGPPLPRP